jgi:hypothetical protein
VLVVVVVTVVAMQVLQSAGQHFTVLAASRFEPVADMPTLFLKSVALHQLRFRSPQNSSSGFPLQVSVVVVVVVNVSVSVVHVGAAAVGHWSQRAAR